VSQPLRKTPHGDAEPRRAEYSIPHLLKNLHHSVRQAVEEAFRVQRIDMSFAHFLALLTLKLEPGVAGAEIARRAYVTAQTMNTILRRLESDGDIERQPNPQNARADSWFITKAGQARFDRAKVIGEAVWMRMLSVLKPTEIKLMQDMLERCIAGLDAQVDEVRLTKPAKVTPAAKAARRR
jgi:DNA-binding MarR family transcriptional regulator